MDITELKAIIDANIFENTSQAITGDALNDVLNLIADSLGEYVPVADIFDESGTIRSALLPSYVDDVLEFSTRDAFPAVGEGGKIYLAADTNLSYRWGGSEYVIIAQSLALGETSSTAYRGDRGKIAYDHSQTSHRLSIAGLEVSALGGSIDTDALALALSIPELRNAVVTHTGNSIIHITAAERIAWNKIASYFYIDEATGNLVTDRNVIIRKNLTVGGDTSTGGKGEDTGVSGTVTGIRVDANTILEPTNGIVDMSDVLANIDVDLSNYYTKQETTSEIAKAVDDLNLGQYAKASDLDALAVSVGNNATNIRNLKASVYTKDDLAAYKSWWDDLMGLIVKEGNDIKIKTNLIVAGDTTTGGTGSDAGTSGTVIGVVVNGQSYKDETNGMLDLSTLMNQYALTSAIPSLEGYAKIADVSAALAGYQPLITASNKLDYSLIANTPGLKSLAFKDSLSVSEVVGLQSALSNKQDALGYTPVNKAGDTMSGNLNVNGVRLGRNVTGTNRAFLRLDPASDMPADIVFGRDANASSSAWENAYWVLSSRNDSENKVFGLWRAAGNSGTGSEAFNSEQCALIVFPNCNVKIGDANSYFSADRGYKLWVNGTFNAVGQIYQNGTPLGSFAFLNSISTSSVSEGSNLYFTNARAISACDGRYLPEPTQFNGNLQETTSWRTFNSNIETGIGFKRNGVASGYVGAYDDCTYLADGHSNPIYLKLYPNGDITWGNNTIYHAGNSNKTSVAWSASSLTLNGPISGATTITASGYFIGDGYRLGKSVAVGNRACLLLNSNTNTPADIIFRSGNYVGNTYGDWALSSRGNENGNNDFYIARGAYNGGTAREDCIIQINHNGYVIIGQSVFNATPSAQLHVEGNAIITGDTSTGSDIRFKDIIKDHRIALKSIAQAPLFTFKWNDREDDTIHLGTSAQYWESVAPWLVKGTDFKVLDYSTLGVAIGISLANKTVNLEERVKILEEQLKKQIYGS